MYLNTYGLHCIYIQRNGAEDAPVHLCRVDCRAWLDLGEPTGRNARLPGAVRERGIFLEGQRPAQPPFIPPDVKL